MSKTVNKFLLTREKFMPEMHLKQPGFTYSACSPFTKNKEKIKISMQSRNSNFNYKTILIELVFNAIWRIKRFSLW